MNRYEALLESELATSSPVYGCKYIKIPDAIATKNSLIKVGNRFVMKEYKRPFDGILVTPNYNYLIECKADYNTLDPDQKKTYEAVSEINESMHIIRIKVNNKKFEKSYRIEKPEKNVIFETKFIGDIIKYFKDKKGA